MLYSKEITKIAWDDIEEFCNQSVAENATLDYKKDFPTNLQKSIAAFANTMGGIILIGVDEDQENKPKLPIEGIPFKRGISERIMNIILSNVTPPIIPEIQICTNEDKSKAIAVIRVPQSNKTPHAINKNTEVYIRTGNRTNSEPLATVEKLFWLADGREKSVLLREQIFEEAKDRFEIFYDKALEEALAIGTTQYSSDFSRLTLALSPCYPQELFCTPPQLKELLNDIYVSDYFGSSDSFPITDYRSINMHQHGINLGLFYKDYAYYSELSAFGVYYYRQHLFGQLDGRDRKPEHIIRFNEIIARIDQLFQSANKFYSSIGFNGLLNFYFSIDGLSKFFLKIGTAGNTISTIEERVHHSNTFMKSQLIANKKQIIFSTVKNLAWAYNWDIKEEYFKHFEKHFPAL